MVMSSTLCSNCSIDARDSSSLVSSSSAANISGLLFNATTTVGLSGNGSDSADNFGDLSYQRLYKLVSVLDRYLIPVIVGIGVFGNAASFLVFTATYLRRMSSSVYLAALAIVDTMFLIVLFFTWLTSVGVQVSGLEYAPSSRQFIMHTLC